MPIPDGSRHVYDELVEGSDADWLLGLLAFAIVEEQRIEWDKHFERSQGRRPAEDEVRRWYGELPPAQLLRARGDAENALSVYAAELLAAFRDAERDSVRDGAIVQEIRLARRFWPQFGIGIAAGVVSSFVFALLLVAAFIIVENDPSLIGVGRDAIQDRAGEGAGNAPQGN